MLELIICDDEKTFRNDLKEIAGTELELCGIPYRLAEFTCGEDLIDALSFNDKQIIFLDIEMGKMDGMATAHKIREKSSDAVIIFVTSYSDYVFQGYEVRALNYILKPYAKEHIIAVLHEALKQSEISEERYYIIEQRGSSIRLPIKDINYFFSDKRSVTAVTTAASYSFYGKLDDIHETLPDYFIRIHNRYLINLSCLKSIDGNTTLIGSDVLPVSRSCKQTLSIAFAKYMLK